MILIEIEALMMINKLISNKVELRNKILDNLIINHKIITLLNQNNKTSIMIRDIIINNLLPKKKHNHSMNKIL